MVASDVNRIVRTIHGLLLNAVFKIGCEMKLPAVFLYDYRDGAHQLYLGGYSTLDGLRLFAPATAAQVQNIYADDDASAPNWEQSSTTVQAVCELVSQRYASSLVDFECQIGPAIKMSTHDDSECHFECRERADIERLLKSVAPQACQDAVWAALTTNMGQYVVCGPEFQIKCFQSFEDYLNST